MQVCLELLEAGPISEAKVPLGVQPDAVLAGPGHGGVACLSRDCRVAEVTRLWAALAVVPAQVRLKLGKGGAHGQVGIPLWVLLDADLHGPRGCCVALLAGLSRAALLPTLLLHIRAACWACSGQPVGIRQLQEHVIASHAVAAALAMGIAIPLSHGHPRAHSNDATEELHRSGSHPRRQRVHVANFRVMAEVCVSVQNPWAQRA
mmetsp:Transcript_6627/g.18089  ORF Transcript_6627/g.18089 Transcript_6627/m.18089 type:complete len:205 (-) Transcript_6627:32-646(-)